jgi:hypothetical protein
MAETSKQMEEATKRMSETDVEMFSMLRETASDLKKINLKQQDMELEQK